ncbi:MAG TPA: fatty acid desaturase, partial [Candidatus Paceibacterota bacterium]|nr:fatty acid desaturase [Candidatus Paceibacterota bacterium]
HHRYSDTEHDLHSPARRGFLWAHVGWVVCKKYSRTETKAIPDFARYPELRFLDDWHWIPPVFLAAACFLFGWSMERWVPSLNVGKWQALVWGYFISSIVLYHATFCINSLAHVVGFRRFATSDSSRNNFLLALATMGEGWHNNHHRYAASERQGFYWWEIDISHWFLTALSWVGLVKDLKSPPVRIYSEAKKSVRPWYRAWF